jgi:hypothetical protein
MEDLMHFLARIACLLPTLVLPVQAQDSQPKENPPSQNQPEQNQPGQPNQDPNKQHVEIDTNLICDTRQQVERFVSLLDENKGSAEAAITGVNEENKTQDACVIATAAYRRAGVAATVKQGDTTFDVTRIVVIGVYTVNGLERSLPTEFFTLIPREGTSSGTVGRGQQIQE